MAKGMEQGQSPVPPPPTTNTTTSTTTASFVYSYFQHMITLLKTHPDLDPNAPSGLGDAPIHAIVKKKAHSKAERADKMTTLFNLLVYSNADVNATAAYGMTALHMAANVCNLRHTACICFTSRVGLLM